MFAIAQPDANAAAAPVAGLGIVRACVANADGTSNLILQGIGRVAISEFKMSPFPHASLSPLADTDEEGNVARSLRSEVENLLVQLRKSGVEMPQGFDGYLAQMRNPGAFADAVASVFVVDPEERRHFLEESSVPARLSRLLRCLVQQLAQS
jgi:ATP-dependent Lon protease